MLQALDITLLSNPDSANAAIAAEVADIPRNMGDRSIEELLDAPLVADPKIQVAIELLVNAAPVHTLASLKPSVYRAQDAESVASAWEHAGFLFCLQRVWIHVGCSVWRRTSWCSFSEMSIQLNENCMTSVCAAPCFICTAITSTSGCGTFGPTCRFWNVRSSRVSRPAITFYANYLAFETIWQLFEIGVPLEDILAESERFARFSKKTRNEAVYQTIRLQQQFFRSLSGKTDRPLVLSEAGLRSAGQQEDHRGCQLWLWHRVWPHHRSVARFLS